MPKNLELNAELNHLADLLEQIRQVLYHGDQPTKAARLRIQNLRASVNQLTRLLKKTPSDITIESIMNVESRFAQMLRKDGYAPATTRNHVSRLRALIRYAWQFKYKHPRFALIDKWNIIPVDARKLGTPFIIRYAIENGIPPEAFSRSHLDDWSTSVTAGKSLEEVERQRKHFSYTVKKLKLLKIFKNFETEECCLLHYGLRLEDMPPRLRADVEGLLRWAEVEQKAGRLKGRNTILLQQNLERLCGYAINVKRMHAVTRIEQLLTKSFLYSYTSWLTDKRGCSRTAVINALGAIHQLLIRHPRFDNHNFNWWKELLQELEPELKSDVDERRRQRLARFEDLAAIPDKIRTERLQPSGLSLKEKALMVRSELMLRFLVKAVMAPVCVRRATLSNIRKARVPLNDPSFVIADWAKPLLEANPKLSLWQFWFAAEETPRGKSVQGLILNEMVELLDAYVQKWRPILLGGAESDSLFFRERDGKPLSGTELCLLFKSLTQRYAGIGVTPGSVKPSFVEFWLEQYPNGQGWVSLANILWMEYASVRQAFDPGYRSRFAGKSAK